MSGKKVILIRAGYSGSRLPHALLSLAANLDDEVLVLDRAVARTILRHKDEIKDALCVGISTITGTYIKHSLDVAKTIRSINPDVPLIWGGWHPSLKPEQTLENENVDKVVVGQGEKAFRNIVEKIKNGEEVEDIVAYDYINRSEFNFYDLDLLKGMERYISPYISPRTISLYLSQGCPFRCKFCAVNSVYGVKYSGWPVEKGLDLIKHCVKTHFIDGVSFDDDNFFIGKKRALSFADQLLKSNLNINWSADARIDLACDLEAEEWEMLDASGCKRLLVGAESGSQVTLDKLNKRITPDMIVEFGVLCAKYNIIPLFSMMVGVPGETQDDIEQTFSLIDTLKSKVPTSELLLFLYTPYPGTPLYDQALEMGFEEPDTLEGWSNFYLDVPTVPWVDDKLRDRVKKYNRDMPTHRDISLKGYRKRKFNLGLKIKAIQNSAFRIQDRLVALSGMENKREVISDYLHKQKKKWRSKIKNTKRE